MPTRIFEAGPGTATADLHATSVAVDEIFTESLGPTQRIVVSYTLYPQEGDETFIHQYEFYTDDYDEQGSAWAEFVNLITARDNSESLIYHAKRNGGVMFEFTDLCLEEKQCAAKA